MTSQPTHIDEWLNRAFQLAYFLHGDRKMAMEIALNAMNKLETASNAQFKRNYYTPTGRAENLRATRSRVSMNDLQLLQRLVFVESETFERLKEKANKLDKKNLITYFIKHLVRISLKRNSFYVTLGMSRILHNYGTNDAMEIYNIVMQDPDRIHDDYYYRSRKGVLMKELKSRFDNFLEVVKGNRGEERFQTQTTDEKLIETVKSCLQFFTPWKTECAIPDKFNPFNDEIQSFKFEKKDPDAEHRIEVNRIHAALHPHCFNRLTNALKLPPPAEKMEIPKFMFAENQQNIDDNNDDRRNPPALDANELQQIKDVLTAQAESRRNASTNFLRVVVDGNEQARMNLDETDSVKFNLDESAELIEVRVVEKDGDVVLATHLLNFEDLENGNQIQSVLLEGGQKVSFNFVPTKDEYNEVIGLNCGVEYAETAWHKRLLLAFRRAKFVLSAQPSSFLKPAFALGLILLALVSGWFIYQRIGDKKDNLAGKDDSVLPNQPSEIKLPPVPKDAPKDENKNAVNNSVNSSVNNDLPKPKIDSKVPLIKTDANKTDEIQKPKPESKPVLRKAETNVEPSKVERAVNNPPKIEKKNILNSDEILRVPIRESAVEKENTALRSPKNKGGKSLADVKRIYIEILGDETSSGQIGNQISSELLNNKTFAISSDKESADAVLKISVQRESERGTTAVIVRLVNSEGFVIYPNQKQVSGWKYAGKTEKLSGKIVRDLIFAKGNAKGKK